MPGPSLNNLLNEYVDTIPVLPEWVSSGEKADNYFRLKHEHTDISLFNNPKFERKLKQFALTPNQENHFWFLANQYNKKVHKKFDGSD